MILENGNPFDNLYFEEDTLITTDSTGCFEEGWIIPINEPWEISIGRKHNLNSTKGRTLMGRRAWLTIASATTRRLSSQCFSEFLRFSLWLRGNYVNLRSEIT